MTARYRKDGCFNESIGFKQFRRIIENEPDKLIMFPKHFFVRAKPFFVENGTMDRIVELMKQYGFVLKKTRIPVRYDHLTEYHFERDVD